MLNIKFAETSGTCVQQTAPDGYFRNQDCKQFNLLVCEVYEGALFMDPAEGRFLAAKAAPISRNVR